MVYRIAFEADSHWGAIRPEDHYRASFIIKKFLAEFPLDLYINLGDFFDTKLLLNSKASIYAIRDMSEKVAICRDRGIISRVIKGTRGHDYDQLDAFNHLAQDPSNLFQYFKSCTVEETLPGMRIWYAPEENINFTQYLNEYADMLLDGPIHLAAMHGNFDKIMPAIAVQMAESDKTGTNLIFRYDDLEPVVRGPMVAGHWHDGDQHQHLSYVGSFNRWIFGEDELKGFAIYEYDTETGEYRCVKVPNVLASRFKTYEVFTSLYRGTKEYSALIDAVRASIESDPNMHVRVLIKINELHPDTEQQIENLKFTFANSRNVHFTIINQVKAELKKKEKVESKKLESEFAFVRDKNIDTITKIQRYIEMTTGHSYSVEDIQHIIGPYLS